jgi:hypothetical protein
VRVTKAALAIQTDRLNGKVKMFLMKDSGGRRNMKAFLKRHILRSLFQYSSHAKKLVPVQFTY